MIEPNVESEDSLEEENEIPSNITKIETEENAIDVGVAIAEGFYRQESLMNHNELYICHYKVDDVWLYIYTMDQREEEFEYGGVNVAINGADCSLIQAWAEE